MKLTRRDYQGEEDYFRIRQFLREVYLLNNRREMAWQAYRFDYWRWHVNENICQNPLEEVISIWETQDGQIAGVLNPEGNGEAHLQIHPAYRTTELEEEMIALAEKRLARVTPEGKRRLAIFAHQHDQARTTLLSKLGYSQSEWQECQRRRPVDQAIPDKPLAHGYNVRSLADREELPARSWASWRAFHPDEPDEKYEGWEWYPNVQRAPLYRRDLDIVAETPCGEIAAFCTVWFDDVTRTGSFEPVGTVPEHQRRGLGTAVMSEGLRRLNRLGATLATVGSEGPAGHGLYNAMGFTEFDANHPWIKEF